MQSLFNQPEQDISQQTIFDSNNSSCEQGNKLLWLKFCLLNNINLAEKLALLQVFKHPNAIFAQSHAQLKSILPCRRQKSKTNNNHNKNLFYYDEDKFEQIKSYLELNKRVRLIPINDQLYPKPLGNIAKPPLLLYAVGNMNLLSNQAVAIVGSRHASYYGKEMAFDMARSLASHNVTVVSGMAAGVDSCAHKGSLSATADNTIGASTIAILGTGINICYPRSNRKLYQQIAEKGLLLTEFHPGDKPLPFRFPQRNRIISGLSRGVLVVEASLNSGSLITAKMAMEENRDVFALPGSVHSVHSKGCHFLIKQGAQLVESVDDIIQEYDYIPSNNIRASEASIKSMRENKLKESLTKAQGNVLNSIEFTATSVEKILVRSKVNAQDLSVILLQLELANCILQEETQQYRRII